MNTTLITLSRNSIDRTDQLYRIGSCLCRETAELSIGQWGILEPLLVQKHGNGYRIVDGFDRYDCAVRHGITEFPAVATELDDLSCYRFALFKAIGNQSYDIFDASASLRILSEQFSIPKKEIIAQYLPLFGFACHEKFFTKLMALNELDADQVHLLRSEPVETEKILLLSEIDQSIRPDMIALFVQLRPGINKCRQILELLDEIAGREQIPVGEILRDPSLQTILSDETCNAGQKLNRFREALHERRNPTLVQTMELVDQKIRQLKLDNRVKLIVPAYLEGDQLRVEATFENPDQLKEIARNLMKTADLKLFGELIDIIKEP